MVAALSQLQQNHQETKLHLRFWIVTLLFELIQKRKKKHFMKYLRKLWVFIGFWIYKECDNEILKKKKIEEK